MKHNDYLKKNQKQKFEIKLEKYCALEVILLLCDCKKITINVTVVLCGFAQELYIIMVIP